MAFSTGFEGALEEVRAQLLKPGLSYGRVELDSLKQGINLNVGLGVRGALKLNLSKNLVFCPN